MTEIELTLICKNGKTNRETFSGNFAYAETQDYVEKNLKKITKFYVEVNGRIPQPETWTKAVAVQRRLHELEKA